MPKKTKKTEPAQEEIILPLQTGHLPSHTLEDTDNENLKKLVDWEGDWQFYYIVDEKRFVKAVNFVLSLGFSKGPRFVSYLKTHSAEEIEEAMTSGGNRGTRVHMAIRMLVAGEEITMTTKFHDKLSGQESVLTLDEWTRLEAFKRFAEHYQMEAISDERAVYSSKHSFAGTFDQLCTVLIPDKDRAFPKEVWGKRVLFLPDWKTSGAIYEEYRAQTAAYTKAVKEMGLFTSFFKAYKGLFFTGVVRLGSKHKSGYEVEAWDEKTTDSNFNVFTCAQVIADVYVPEFNVEMRNIPDTLSVKVPVAKLEKIKRKKTNVAK